MTDIEKLKHLKGKLSRDDFLIVANLYGKLGGKSVAKLEQKLRDREEILCMLFHWSTGCGFDSGVTVFAREWCRANIDLAPVSKTPWLWVEKFKEKSVQSPADTDTDAKD